MKYTLILLLAAVALFTTRAIGQKSKWDSLRELIKDGDTAIYLQPFEPITVYDNTAHDNGADIKKANTDPIGNYVKNQFVTLKSLPTWPKKIAFGAVLLFEAILALGVLYLIVWVTYSFVKYAVRFPVSFLINTGKILLVITAAAVGLGTSCYNLCGYIPYVTKEKEPYYMDSPFQIFFGIALVVITIIGCLFLSFLFWADDDQKETQPETQENEVE